MTSIAKLCLFLVQSGESISIVGTGDFARAFSQTLATHRYTVTCGSRQPNDRKTYFFQRFPPNARKYVSKISVVSIEKCLCASDIVILAVHPENAEAILREHVQQLAGKIIVDVSNPELSSADGKSVVEELAERYSAAKFVKALNSLSAYQLENGDVVGDRVVCIAGNDKAATSRVEALVTSLGFRTQVAGDLSAARGMELAQITVFSTWGKPLVLSVGIFAAWGVYGTMRYQVWKGNPWSMLPVNTMNKVYGCSALTLLSLCYLPGCLAAGLQLVRGTKHKPFPGWLDAWMKMRKELGLISLAFAATHCVLSVAHLSPPYFTNWYTQMHSAPVVNGQVSIPTGGCQFSCNFWTSSNVVATTSIAKAQVNVPTGVTMNWKGETVILLGSLALGGMSILGVTSLPSVMTQLNWKQWDFIHSKLGMTTLAFATAHVVMKGAPDWPGKAFVEIAKGKYKHTQFLLLL